MRVRLAVAVLLAGVVGLLAAGLAAVGPGQNPGSQAASTAASAGSAASAIEAAIEKGGLAGARAKMDDIEARPDAYAVNEREINALGYRCLSQRAFDAALAIFEFNARRFPDSNNAYDSLAEAAAAAGDNARLEQTLAAWLDKRPGDRTIEDRVAAIRALSRRYEDERRHAWRPGQPTGVTGRYFGQTPPGTTPVLFAPGIVSMAGTVEGGGTMSPDGEEFYFEARGRTPGAVVAPATGRASFGADPAAVMVSRLGRDGWTFPEQVAVTRGFGAREPHVSADNLRLYWEWLRAVPDGEADPLKLGTGIWASERTAAGWSAPSYVGQAMAVSTSRSGEVFVTDISELPKGEHIARAVMKKGRFAGFERPAGGLARMAGNTAHPCVAPDGSYLIFDAGGPPARVSFRSADGTWGDPVDLSQHGFDARARVTAVSPDGKYLFLAKGGDIYWVSAQVVEALRPPMAERAARR